MAERGGGASLYVIFHGLPALCLAAYPLAPGAHTQQTPQRANLCRRRFQLSPQFNLPQGGQEHLAASMAQPPRHDRPEKVREGMGCPGRPERCTVELPADEEGRGAVRQHENRLMGQRQGRETVGDEDHAEAHKQQPVVARRPGRQGGDGHGDGEEAPGKEQPLGSRPEDGPPQGDENPGRNQQEEEAVDKQQPESPTHTEMVIIRQEEQRNAEHPGGNEKAAQPQVVAKVLRAERAFDGRGREHAEEANAAVILRGRAGANALGVHGVSPGPSMARRATYKCRTRSAACRMRAVAVPFSP